MSQQLQGREDCKRYAASVEVHNDQDGQGQTVLSD